MKPLFSLRRNVSYQDVWGRGGNWADVVASPTARLMSTTSTLACVDIKASSIMAMPLQEFTENRDGSTVKVPAGSQSGLVVDPSRDLTRDEWVYAACASLTLWDETVGLVVERAGRPVGVELLCPDNVDVRAENGVTVYYVGGVRHESWRRGGDIWHVRRRPLPGVANSLSTSDALKPLVDAGLEGARQLAATYFNGGLPPAHLKYDGPLDPDEASSVSESFVQSRRRDPGRPLVTGNKWSMETFARGSLLEDMAPLRKQIATEIAAVHGVPPQLIGGDGGNMTYANLEGLTRHLEARTLLADYTLLERALSRLLPPDRFVRFNSDAIVRTSLGDRYRAHESAVRTGWKTVDEVRADEDMPPLPVRVPQASTESDVQ